MEEKEEAGLHIKSNNSYLKGGEKTRNIQRTSFTPERKKEKVTKKSKDIVLLPLKSTNQDLMRTLSHLLVDRCFFLNEIQKLRSAAHA